MLNQKWEKCNEHQTPLRDSAFCSAVSSLGKRFFDCFWYSVFATHDTARRSSVNSEASSVVACASEMRSVILYSYWFMLSRDCENRFALQDRHAHANTSPSSWHTVGTQQRLLNRSDGHAISDKGKKREEELTSHACKFPGPGVSLANITPHMSQENSAWLGGSFHLASPWVEFSASFRNWVCLS